MLYAITDRMWLNDESLYDQVNKALDGGVTCVQLREKDLDESSFLEEAFEIKKLCAAYHVPFIINDNVYLAKKVDADGVHIGQSDLSLAETRGILGGDKIIGVSVHNVKEALSAQKNGADYLGAGALFNTKTKSDVNIMSHLILKDICASVSIPVIAIGGINCENIASLRGTGISGVAVISAIFAALDIKSKAEELKKLAHEMVNL